MCEELYNVCDTDSMVSYIVEKETATDTITISVYKNSPNKGKRLLSRISYPREREGYNSPFLSWYNLIFCSNNCGPSPRYDYMHTAVQLGKKTAATVYIHPDSSEGKDFIKSLPKECGAIPYGDYMIYVFRKGRLADFFDFETIRRLYENNCMTLFDWSLIKELFNKPLSYFGDPDQCGFDLQRCVDVNNRIIVGLLLGYPVESTIECINHNGFHIYH